MPTVFVDRSEDLAAFGALVDGLGRGHGGAVVFEGSSGMGKSTLLGRLGEVLGNAGERRCRLVTTRCRPAIGPGLTYEPIVDLLTQLGTQAPPSRPVRRILKRSARAAARSAPDVLSSLVPGLGAVFTLGREVTKAALETGSIPFDSLAPFQQGVALQIVEALLSVARSGPPVVMVIDDIQDIDPTSLSILDRLLQALRGEPVAVVLSFAPQGSDGPVGTLLGRWEREHLISRRTLTGLPADAVAELVLRQHPSAPSALSAKLSEVTRGHPVFVALCLEQWRPQDGASVVVPEELERVVEDRFRLLEPGDRELVEIAAVHGVQFFSRTVALAAGVDHESAMGRLRGIARESRLIVAQDLPPWVGSQNSDCYRFEHRALWEVVYEWQTPGQRRSRHARIAAAWSGGSGWDYSAPLARRLEIAHHLRNGGPDCLAASTDAHYALAWSAATDGLSYIEAEEHCAEAIRAARALPHNQDGRDRRLAEAIELLLSLTEVRWRGQHEETGEPGHVDTMAAEAEAAAERHGDAVLIARTTLLRGKTLLATQGVEPSLVKLWQAVERASGLDDPRALFVARVEYGRQVGKRNLAQSLEVLSEAERMYACEPGLGASADPVLQHARNLGEMQLGIAHFDSGHLSEAIDRLQRCTDRLQGEALQAELPIALNYLAQVRLGLGDFGQARHVLERARSFEADRGGDSGWHAYNTALLALSFADDAEHQAEARVLIEQAWQETVRTWLINLVPIVRNLYAEILLRTTDGTPADLDQADRLAEATRVETRQSGMVRSTIAALILRSRVSLARGHSEQAVEHVGQALRILEDVGDMPALRTEEVLYYAALAHHAAGDQDQARVLVERARAEVNRKAAHILDPVLLYSFRHHEPLNQRILDDQPFR